MKYQIWILCLAFVFGLNSALAEKALIVSGGPGVLGAVKKHQAEIQKAHGITFEFREANADLALVAVANGYADISASAVPMDDLLTMDAVKSAKITDSQDFEQLHFTNSTIMAVVHPKNPVTALSHTQIRDILSGKIRTWESITGQKDQIKVFLNKTQTATIRLLPKFYLDKPEIPDAHHVTTLKAVAKSLEANPGGISFSGSKFQEDGFSPKFIDTDSKIPYILIAKKPLSPAVEKTFAAFKTKN